MSHKAGDEGWATAWLDRVASGQATMSQRAMSAVEKHGGLERLVAAARERGVHLVQLTDDGGRDLVVGSRTPFRTLC